MFDAEVRNFFNAFHSSHITSLRPSFLDPGKISKREGGRKEGRGEKRRGRLKLNNRRDGSGVTESSNFQGERRI